MTGAPYVVHSEIVDTSEIIQKGLLVSVRGGLNRRKGQWDEISDASDVPYDTVAKIARGTTPEPGVLKCQRLWWTLAALDDAFAALSLALAALAPRRMT